MGFFDFFSINKKKINLKSATNAVVDIKMQDEKWSDKNYESFARESYMLNVIAYRCIDLVAKSTSMVPFGYYNTNKDGKLEYVNNSKIQKIWKRPNPFTSFPQFQKSAVSYLYIAGNSYLQNILGKEIYCLRPDYMSAILYDNKLSGYKYKPTGNPDDEKIFPIDPITNKCEILHLKNFHPIDDIYGLSPIEVASREIDTNNEGTSWNMRIMQNDGRPGMMVFIRGFLTTEQRDELERNIKELTSGSKNAGKSLIIESESGSSGLSDAKPYSWTPKELDWLESNRELSRRICFAMGVAPLLINIPGDSTYSNYKEARIALWEETIIPLIDYLAGEYTYWLLDPESDVVVNYDISKIPAIIDRQTVFWERAEKSTFLTINEKREIVGYKPVVGGDEILMPASLIPISEVGIESKETQNDEDVEEDLNENDD